MKIRETPTNEIDYDGPIPKTLRTYCDRHANQIATVDYGSGFASATGWGYQVLLRYGWCFDPQTHIETANNVREMLGRLRSVVVCACAECREGLAE